MLEAMENDEKDRLDMLSHVWCHIKRTVPPCHSVVNYLIDITKKLN